MVGENRLGNVVLQMLLNWEFTHAKPRQEYGVESLRSESPDAGRGADAGCRPYFVPRLRDFEGRPQRAGLVSRLGGIRLGLALPSER